MVCKIYGCKICYPNGSTSKCKKCIKVSKCYYSCPYPYPSNHPSPKCIKRVFKIPSKKSSTKVDNCKPNKTIYTCKCTKCFKNIVIHYNC